MALTKAERFDHAARLILELLEDPEFSRVYEDEQLEDLSEKEQKKIHDLMFKAKVTVTFPGADVKYKK